MKLTEKLRQLSEQIKKESIQRNMIVTSQEYVNLQKQIEELTNDRDAMLLGLQDSVPEYEATKRELIDYMKDNLLDNVDGFEAKTRAKNEVNTRRVMECLQGDLDNFFLLATVKQTSLKDFCKANPEYKGMEKECVVEIGRDIVDVFPSTSTQ